MWFTLNLLVLIGVGFVCGSDQCRQSCSTWSSWNNKQDNQSYVPCDIQYKACKMKPTNGTYPINPTRPKINKQRNWYLYKNPTDGANHIALNFSWSPNHDGSVEYLQAYQVKIHRKMSHTTSLSPDLLLYFCFENKFEFNRHLLSQFYYDCYGLASDQLIQPGDIFNIYISSLPQPGPMLDYEHRNLEIKIPGCDNKNLATEAYCEQLNSAFVKVKQTFYANRTVLVSYNMPKIFGRAVTILLCYAEEYNPYFTLCEIEHDITGLPMSDSDYYFVLPDDFDIHKNISLSVYGNSTNSLRFKKYFTFTPEVKTSSGSDSPVVFIAVAIGSVLLLVVIAFVVLCKFRPESAKHVAKFCCPALVPNTSRSVDNKDHPQPENDYIEVDTMETKPLVKVCIAFVEDNSLHRDVVLAFASYLQTDLGFEVMLELWQRDEIFKDCSGWIEKVLNSADKIIVIWSPGANQRWEIQKNGANAVPLDLFTPILKKIKNDLVFGRNKGRYFFTYFQYCSESDIPQSFRDKSPCYFKIMPQMKELYFRLIDQEMFQPGAIINEKKAEYETYSSEDINKFGAILKSKISEMSKFAGTNPNWHQQSSTIQTQVSIDPSVDDDILQINKLVIEPPPPLLVDSQPSVCDITKKDIPSPVETPVCYNQTRPACKHYTKPAKIFDEKPKKQFEPLVIVVPKRTPCENAEVFPARQNFQEFPVLEPLGNLTDKDESFVQDSGFSTQSPLISSLQSECDGSIHPSSFHFDDNDSDNDEPGLPAIQLVPIDTEKDPWESLASFNF